MPCRVPSGQLVYVWFLAIHREEQPPTAERDLTSLRFESLKIDWRDGLSIAARIGFRHNGLEPFDCDPAGSHAHLPVSVVQRDIKSISRL